MSKALTNLMITFMSMLYICGVIVIGYTLFGPGGVLIGIMVGGFSVGIITDYARGVDHFERDD